MLKGFFSPRSPEIGEGGMFLKMVALAVRLTIKGSALITRKPAIHPGTAGEIRQRGRSLASGCPTQIAVYGALRGAWTHV